MDLFYIFKPFSAFYSQPPPGRIPSREEQELLNTQLGRIHTLFRRQLAIPLMGENDVSSVQTECKTGRIPVVKALCHGPPGGKNCEIHHLKRYRCLWRLVECGMTVMWLLKCNTDLEREHSSVCCSRGREILLHFIILILAQLNGEQRQFYNAWNLFLSELLTRSKDDAVYITH